MSYILDALKKSESERQRQDAPGFADVPVKQHARSMPAWMWLLIGLLLINALILGAVLLRGFLAAPAQVTAAPRVERSLPLPASAEPAPLREQPAPDKPPGNEVGTARSATPPARTPLRGAEPAPAKTPPALAGYTRVGTTTASTANLPTILELGADGTLQLPELHLDIHVYSATPDDRFVFVNMSKYREAARLAEGPLVKEIVPDGVILEYRNTTFLLPRE